MTGRHLAFLHTAAAHVPRFDALVAEVDPEVVATHVVDEDLLRAAVAGERGIEGRVRECVLELCQAGSPVVVCTCSTLGPLAEAAGRVALPDREIDVMRIERPMVEAAVAHPRIGVVAALPSALESVEALLHQVASERGRSITVERCLRAGAWRHFEAGAGERFVTEVARALPALSERVDVIVVAQASLAALSEWAELPVPVLSSPRSGVVHAVERFRRHVARSSG